MQQLGSLSTNFNINDLIHHLPFVKTRQLTPGNLFHIGGSNLLDRISIPCAWNERSLLVINSRLCREYHEY